MPSPVSASRLQSEACLQSTLIFVAVKHGQIQKTSDTNSRESRKAIPGLLPPQDPAPLVLTTNHAYAIRTGDSRLERQERAGLARLGIYPEDDRKSSDSHALPTCDRSTDSDRVRGSRLTLPTSTRKRLSSIAYMTGQEKEARVGYCPSKVTTHRHYLSPQPHPAEERPGPHYQTVGAFHRTDVTTYQKPTKLPAPEAVGLGCGQVFRNQINSPPPPCSKGLNEGAGNTPPQRSDARRLSMSGIRPTEPPVLSTQRKPPVDLGLAQRKTAPSGERTQPIVMRGFHIISTAESGPSMPPSTTPIGASSLALARSSSIGSGPDTRIARGRAGSIAHSRPTSQSPPTLEVSEKPVQISFVIGY